MRKWLLNFVLKGVVSLAYSGEGAKSRLREDLTKEFVKRVHAKNPRLQRDRVLEIAEDAASVAINHDKYVTFDGKAGVWKTQKRGK
jgi:hypothetical protein